MKVKKINENVLTDIIDRSRTCKPRKEDSVNGLTPDDFNKYLNENYTLKKGFSILYSDKTYIAFPLWKTSESGFVSLRIFFDYPNNRPKMIYIPNSAFISRPSVEEMIKKRYTIKKGESFANPDFYRVKIYTKYDDIDNNLFVDIIENILKNEDDLLYQKNKINENVLTDVIDRSRGYMGRRSEDSLNLLDHDDFIKYLNDNYDLKDKRSIYDYSIHDYNVNTQLIFPVCRASSNAFTPLIMEQGYSKKHIYITSYFFDVHPGLREKMMKIFSLKDGSDYGKYCKVYITSKTGESSNDVFVDIINFIINNIDDSLYIRKPINENVLTDIIDRSRTGSLRKEDMLHPKNYKELNDIIESEYEKQRKNLDLRHIDVSKIDDLSNIFFNMKDLETIDVTGWNVNSVKYMNNMFSHCLSLKEIKGLENWNVSNVTTMSHMFYNCKSLKEIKGIENWDVSNVKHMTNMFSNCESLKEINDIKNWDVSNVINMHCMFSNCKSLEHLDLSGWNMCSVIYMNFMFDGCESLEYLDLSGWNTGSVKYMEHMFCDCKSLKEIRGIENLNINNAKYMRDMFFGCGVTYHLKDKTLIKENVLTDIIDRSRTGSLRKEDSLIDHLTKDEICDYINENYSSIYGLYYPNVENLFREIHIPIVNCEKKRSVIQLYVEYEYDKKTISAISFTSVIFDYFPNLENEMKNKFNLEKGEFYPDAIHYKVLVTSKSGKKSNTVFIDVLNTLIDNVDEPIIRRK